MKTMFSRNGMCAAIEQVLTLPVRGAPRTIEPAKGDKGEAEFVQSVLMTPNQDGGMKTPISELIGQITTAQVFRRSFFERTFKVRESDGRIIYDKIAYRPPATCQARYNDRTGEPNGFRQQVWLFGGNLMLSSKQKVPGYVDIPKIRSYIYTHGKHREPLTGVSELETAYWCYQTQSKLLFLWMSFLEGMAMQRLVVYGNDQPEATARADDISQLRGSGVVGLVHPVQGQKTFEALPSAADAGAQFAACMTYLENWAASSVLAGFLQLSGAAAKGTRAGGGASAGSYGMSEDQSSYYLASREAVATEIADSISHDLIRPLVMLNFGADAAFPQWKFGPPPWSRTWRTAPPSSPPAAARTSTAGTPRQPRNSASPGGGSGHGRCCRRSPLPPPHGWRGSSSTGPRTYRTSRPTHPRPPLFLWPPHR